MKCGHLKTFGSSVKCFLLLAGVFCAVFLVKLPIASASIVYDSISSYTTVASSTPLSSLSPALGASDGGDYYNPAIGTSTFFFFSYPKNIPTNATIDSVVYYMRYFNTYSTGNYFTFYVASSTGKYIQQLMATTTTGNHVVSYLTISSTSNAQWLGSVNNPSYYQNINTSNASQSPSNTPYSGVGTSYVYGWTTNQPTQISWIDAVGISVSYHYDNGNISAQPSVINSASITPYATSSYPAIAVSTSTLTTTYFYDSASDLSSSTAYTGLQYKLHDFFTNQDQYYTSTALQKNISYATSTLTNFCVGAFSCYTGDTYQLSVRFTNANGSLLSAYSSTYFYFSYQNTTPTTATLTHFNSFLYSTSTGLTNLDFYIATSDSPILLALDERNDRDGELPNQPHYYPYPTGQTITTATPIIPTDPNNAGTSYLSASLVSQNDKTLVLDYRVLAVKLASTPASSTSYGGSSSCPPQPCSTTNLGGCFQNALQAVFCPSNGALQVFSTFIAILQTKPPAGYFYVVKNNLANISTSTTPTLSLTIPEHFKTVVFNPFDVGIASILWFFFAINLYKRLKHITI